MTYKHGPNYTRDVEFAMFLYCSSLHSGGTIEMDIIAGCVVKQFVVEERDVVDPQHNSVKKEAKTPLQKSLPKRR